MPLARGGPAIRLVERADTNADERTFRVRGKCDRQRSAAASVAACVCVSKPA